MKPILSAWIAAALLSLSPLTRADDRPSGGAAGFCPPPHGLPGLPPPMLERLQLSADQEDKVFALLHAQAPRQREAGKAAGAARDELRRLVESGRYDAARAKQLAAAHGQAVAEMLLLQAEADAQIRALLTPEQRARLDAGPVQRDRPAMSAAPLH